ncbi:macrophage mannose receptor 1-like [Amphiura filiformis]|uniref:macrophage mannose receptor 1-like n=1 Tax=Amphiura filiformis TaxID=82378 RepID=UPI003B21EFE3
MTPGGHLTKIEHHSINTLITAFLKSLPVDVWIGLHTNNGTGSFTWISDNSEPTYTNWAVGQPSGDSYQASCAKMFNDPDKPGEWADAYCNEQDNAFMCMQPPDPALPNNPPVQSNCSDDWQPYFGSCFKIHSASPLTYPEAKTRCEDYVPGDTFLASIKDRYEQAFIESLFYIEEVEEGWFGLERNAKTGRHVYSNGWPVDFTNWGMEEPSGDGCVAQINGEMSAYWVDTNCQEQKPYMCKYTLGYFEWSDQELVVFENWGDNQPDGKLSNENCIEMQLNNEGLWNDDDCSDLANYICKMPRSNITTLPTTPTPYTEPIDVEPPAGVSIAAVAVPLAFVAAGSIVFAIIVLWRSRKYLKGHPDKTDSNLTMTTSPSIAEPAVAQTYTECDQKTREERKLYQEPHSRPYDQGAQSCTYDNIAEDSNTEDRVYQEIGQPSHDNSQSKV